MSMHERGFLLMIVYLRILDTAPVEDTYVSTFHGLRHILYHFHHSRLMTRVSEDEKTSCFPSPEDIKMLNQRA